MKIESFLEHHGLAENPFGAEEARHDPIFSRLIESNIAHPDFPKVLGQIDRPSTAVVFGEKGTGKTAIRLLIGRRVTEHNDQYPESRTLLVGYDDLNPVLDRVIQRRREKMGAYKAARTSVEQILEMIRLEDHQDAILSLAVTKLVDGILQVTGPAGESLAMPAKVEKRLRKLPRPVRVDLAVLTALYDLPRSGSVVQRWRRLRSKLRLGWTTPVAHLRILAMIAAVLAVVFAAGHYTFFGDTGWLLPAAAVSAAGSLVLLGAWAYRHFKNWSLCRKIHGEVLAVPRQASDLRRMLLELRSSDMENHPWPVSGAETIEGPGKVDRLAGQQDSRYQLTDRLLGVLEGLGYVGMMVLVDRVDEPAVVSGQPDRMRAVVWPMLENKFLQQERVGLKLLLPIELRHLLHRESSSFFQEARMDKQNMVDRLSWSGATLFDLCTQRLRACWTPQSNPGSPTSSESAPPAEMSHVDDDTGSASDDPRSDIQRDTPSPSLARSINLSDLFQDDVSQEMLIDALDQMHQPRDAFKFLYSVLQEHCRSIPEDQPVYQIPRLTLDAVRRHQSQRVQELYRGLTPA